MRNSVEFQRGSGALAAAAASRHVQRGAVRRERGQTRAGRRREARCCGLSNQWDSPVPPLNHPVTPQLPAFDAHCAAPEVRASGSGSRGHPPAECNTF